MSTSTRKVNRLNDVVQKAIEQFKSLTKYPENYLEVQTESAHTLRDVTRDVYDLSKNTEQGGDQSVTHAALPELIIQGFDDEQVWQEIELQNEPVIKHLLHSAAKLGIIQQHAAAKYGLEPRISFNVQIHEPSRVSKSKLPKSKKLSKISKKKLVDIDNEVDDGHNGFIESSISSLYAAAGEQDNDQLSDDDVNDQHDDDSDDDSDDEITRIKASLKQSQRADMAAQDSSDSELELNFPADELEDENLDDDDDINLSEFPRGKKGSKDEFDEEEFSGDDRIDNVGKASLKSKAKQPSIVDDKFFHLSQMEMFLEQEDKRELKKQQKGGDTDDDDDNDADLDEDNDVDMFDRLSSDEEEAEKTPIHSRNVKYDQFFDVPEDEVSGNEIVVKKSVRFEKETNQLRKVDESQLGTPSSKPLFGDNNDDSHNGDIVRGRKEKLTQSTFEKRQAKLKEQITQMEDASLLDKPWQLMGEAAAASRPENSLLEEHLQFDHTARLPPVVTEETTKTLEEIIQQRIKDKAWDDVERKIKPTEDPLEYKKRITLDQEKSKLSLGQIYEQEYLKQQQAEEDTEVKKDDPEHEQIKKLMKYLFTRLDALSNFHYTPKPAIPELQIVSNQPSIRMEEVAPVSMTDVQRLAPEELEDKQKGELKGTTEKSVTDRKRERREKKASKRMREKEKRKKQKLIDKLHPGLGNKYSKEKAMKELEKQSHGDQNLTVIKDSSKKSSTSSLTSSKAFFTQLQQEVTSQISRKKSEAGSGVKKNQKTSKNLKL